jgi:hypothetical protein
LTDIDLDCPEALALAPGFLPPTPARFGRASKTQSHWLYVVDRPLKTTQYKDPDSGTMLVEIRSTGSCTMFPPSLHGESGELVTWQGESHEPERVGEVDLRRGVVLLAGTALLARHWPGVGSRHDTALAVAGVLLSAGLDEATAIKVVTEAARVAGDEEWNERANGVRTTAERFTAGEPVTGRTVLEDLLTSNGKKIVAVLRRWLKPHDTSERLPYQGEGITLEDFHAYMPAHTYLFRPTRQLWPAASVNARIAPPVEGIKASEWLDQYRPVEQMTWAPAEPELIRGRLIAEGGWIERPGVTVFNVYIAPTIALGDPTQAEPWLAHVRKLYPVETEHMHLLAWLAHRVQRPAEKINHAIVLGGGQGIGKDTLLEPVKQAVGPWNVAEVSPTVLMGRFNGFVKSVILRISEARDLGEVNRYVLYDRLKTLTAAPPDVLRVDEKNLREYVVPNLCGVVLTTNYRTDAIYLPSDDRRHFVLWSELVKEEIKSEYWKELWAWYTQGGFGHVAAYLSAYDLKAFNSKAPPPQTEAWHALVDTGRAPECDALVDALGRLKLPDAVTLDDLIDNAPDEESRAWLRDKRNTRSIPHRMEEVGYLSVRNPDDKRGRWVVGRRQRVVYVRKELTVQDRLAAARDRVTGR